MMARLKSALDHALTVAQEWLLLVLLLICLADATSAEAEELLDAALDEEGA